MIGWVLLSREAVARAEEALSSREKGVRDEIGFLALHQGFADRFFPGTSVLHTRLRYALFVPWMMEFVAADARGDYARRLSTAEIALAGQLKSGSDQDGIIGGRVWPKAAAQPPSMSYWTALTAWGLLRPRSDGSTPNRIDVLRLIARQGNRSRIKALDDDGGRLADDPDLPFVQLPYPPEGFLKRDQPLDFNMSEQEHAFLRKHLLGTRRPGTSASSLLARLSEKGVGHNVDDLWASEIADVADDDDRIALTLSWKAAALTCVGRALYAALTERIRNREGLPRCERHQAYLEEVVVDYGPDARALDLSALAELLPNLSGNLFRVLSDTQTWLSSRTPDIDNLRDAYARAEQSRKGLRARLTDNVAGQQRRSEWDPEEHPLAEPLHYRWHNVSRLLMDLQSA